MNFEKTAPSFDCGQGSIAFGRALIILAAVLGAAVSAAVFHEGARALYNAIAENAARYGAMFTRACALNDAFTRAIAISRADIAVIFIALLFPYTAASRPLAAGTSFLRAAVLTPSVPALAFSPIGIISLFAGLLATIPILLRACAGHEGNTAVPAQTDNGENPSEVSRSQRRAALREAYVSAKTAVICSGALLAVRTLLFVIGSVVYN